MIKNPTFSATFTPNWVAQPDSAIQYDLDPLATLSVTNTDNANVYARITIRTQDITRAEFGSSQLLTVDAAGEPDVFALCVRYDTNNEVVRLANIRLLDQY